MLLIVKDNPDELKTVEGEKYTIFDNPNDKHLLLVAIEHIAFKF